MATPLAAADALADVLVEYHADIGGQSDAASEPSDVASIAANALAAAAPTLADVKWNPDDTDQPDYWHLTELAADVEFDLTADDLEALVRSNAFAVKPGLLVFALRGARIIGADKNENVASVRIADQRPNHRDYRCVIGVLNRETKRLWAYKASTVPNAGAVLAGYFKAKRGQLEGNLLPTGCYTFTVGIHRGGSPEEIRGALRLAQDTTSALVVVVLRTIDDVVYDKRDLWDPCAPADNIHPGRHLDSFSSLGCMTLPGTYDVSTQLHSGLWSDFRVALGMGRKFDSTDIGRQFSGVLLTGRDAALAATLRGSGQIADPDKARAALLRLRFGSQGPLVAKLQQKLNIAADPGQLVGPVTRKALIDRQRKIFGWADGILSPQMDNALELHILS
jgi:hypothetical protein